MNYKIIRKILGVMLMLEAIFMILSFLISIYYNQEDKYPFLFLYATDGTYWLHYV